MPFFGLGHERSPVPESDGEASRLTPIYCISSEAGYNIRAKGESVHLLVGPSIFLFESPKRLAASDVSERLASRPAASDQPLGETQAYGLKGVAAKCGIEKPAPATWKNFGTFFGRQNQTRAHEKTAVKGGL